MSHHEKLLVFSLLSLLFMVLWKWDKSLQIIISLEVLVLILISSLYGFGFFSSVVILFLLFFVSEALIILSSLLSAIRIVGLAFSTVSLN